MRSAFLRCFLSAALTILCALFSYQAADAQNPASPVSASSDTSRLNPSYRLALTPGDTLTVQWRPGSARAANTASSGSASASAPVNEEFVKSLMSVLENAMINRISAKVSLESVAVEKGRVRLTGVLLRDVDIGLKLKNDGARRLADLLFDRYGKQPDAPSWARVLPLARLGILNDLEIGLKLDELGVSELGVDADALQVEGFGVRADAGPNENASSRSESDDTLRAILRVLQRAAISRAEAHVNLDHLAADRLKLSLRDLSLKKLHVFLILLRTSDTATTP
jgi:hypothetical protein